MCHKGKNHTAAVAKNKEIFGKTAGGTNKSSDSGEGRSNNLVVSQRFKEVLCARFMLNNDDADKICADILNQEKTRSGAGDMF